MKYRAEGGRQRKYKLGTSRTLSVHEARTKAKKQVGRAADGQDPQAVKRALRSKPAGKTLAELVDQYMAERSPGWKQSTKAT